MPPIKYLSLYIINDKIPADPSGINDSGVVKIKL